MMTSAATVHHASRLIPRATTAGPALAAIAACTLLALPSPALAQGAAPASCTAAPENGVAHQLSSGGRPRTYRLFVPSGTKGTPLPLVLDLHPSGGTADGQARTSGFETLAAREGFAVASLQAENGRWNVPVTSDRADDIKYVSDVIDDISSRVCIDSKRVYADGFSGGARMSSLLACRLSGRIAAIAPMAGLRWPAACDARPVPIITFHGLADQTNFYDRSAPERGGEWVETVPEAMTGWAGHNHCKAQPIQEDPPGPLSTIRYEGCEGGAEVRLIRIDGFGHQWAKTEIDATTAMWAFFKDHALK